MEVAIGSNGNSPFQREVREWQRVDPNTGALLTGRLEADRWINGPLNAYGKVVDSQNLSQPNGTQHTQRKQFEVLQARTSSGSLQVVRAQTVQTSSSRWSSSSTKQVQSSNGQRFSIPLQITNGHHGSTNGYDDLFNHQNHQFMTEPSLKLSTLMRSSTASSSGSRSSPLSPSLGGSSSTSQRHHHDAIPSDGRYRPTSVVADDRVGRGSQERETSDAEHLQRLHRGRSISNDDLAIADWDQNDNDGSESSEWRRVSKIRRSFQFPKSTSPKPSPARPLDLPESLVSVSRIRQELENGRRLSTAMRNNHVDLAALDNILNGSPETEMKSTKKTSFLTAESLKEIRGKLKKLSDESLYKEDFITQSDIEKAKGYDDCPQEGFTLQKPVVLQDSHLIQQPSYQTRSKPEDSHNTNSLENRARHRDTSSAEWHLRRKSYGFEKMAPQSSSMFRQETSTDSGIGRSGDLNSWSPTEGAPRGTIITFGEASSSAKSRVAQMNNHQLVRRYKDTQEAYDSSNDTVEIKRHSIAVDESKYVRDNLRKVFDAKTSIHLNGFYSKEMNSSQSSAFDESGKRHRRVEFCKTEVHFAAESGRVNIVETDGKPPPTNNFRRRRRSSGGAITSAYMEAINSGRPVTHFGDDRKLQFDLDTTVEEILPNGSNVTVITNGGPDVIVPCTVQEEDEDQFGDEISIRGILKNKPVKPKPYHLGENIENSESLWGVRLRPVSGESVPEKSDEPTTVAERRDVSSASNSVAERVRIVEERKDGAGYSTKINLNLSNSPYSWEAPELPKSNVMSIELHSPTVTLQRTSKEAVVSSCQDVPVAKPRNIHSVKTQSIKNEKEESTSNRTESSRKTSNQKAPLKIENGGTRKLKDHELLYFGVKLSNEEQHTNKINQSNIENNRKSATNNEHNTQKWKLSSDKPDLLRHSPIITKVSHSKKTSTTKNGTDQVEIQSDNKGPIYENLKKSSSYNRSKDVQRDQMILNEMTQEADQALKAISSDKSKKDHQRRTPQRSAKPLDTIDERRSSKLRQQPAKIVAARQLGDSYYRQCCSNRSSSVSSTESLSRLTGSTRSKDASEYINMQASKKRSPIIKDCIQKPSHRSSSRDTQRTNASSSEDIHSAQNNNNSSEAIRRSRRIKPKEKEKIVLKVDEQQRITQSTVRTDDRTKSTNKISNDSTKASLRSTKGDKHEKTGTIRSKVSSTRSSSDSRKMSRSKACPGIVSTSSSSKRSSRDHTRK